MAEKQQSRRLYQLLSHSKGLIVGSYKHWRALKIFQPSLHLLLCQSPPLHVFVIKIPIYSFIIRPIIKKSEHYTQRWGCVYTQLYIRSFLNGSSQFVLMQKESILASSLVLFHDKMVKRIILKFFQVERILQQWLQVAICHTQPVLGQVIYWDQDAHVFPAQD